ncbi:alpha/beta fold hydrolase [Alteromonas sp. H39]|uniref:alpha/beta fold hydrolase n=1 Tax=Alteromonas sp. H39 TaxID=3389876 RepID=UPI0039E1FD3E
MERKKCTIDGKVLSYLFRPASEPNAPVCVLLHGFPEAGFAWEGVIAQLPASATIIAPDLPGYANSEPLENDSDYAVPALVSRMSAFIAQVAGGEPVTLVSHDWGGVIAWPLAAFHPQLITRLVILNAAHPGAFSRELQNNIEQREKSAYIHTLTEPDAAKRLADSDYALLTYMLRSRAPDDGYIEKLKSTWSLPGRLHAMLAYYRMLPQPVPAKDDTVTLHIPNIRISQPTKLLWGKKDTAFCLQVTENLSKWVPNLTLEYHDDASHWLHREFPDWVAARIGEEIK